MPENVRTDGPQLAGFRVADRIKKIRSSLGRKDAQGKSLRVPPIILYTINDDERSRSFNRPEEGCHTFIKREVDPDGYELERLVSGG
jgi:hypothetical protein